MSASRDDPFPAGSGSGGARTADDEAFTRAAERVLAWLVPPQVHKLNNLIMQAGGAADLLESGGVADPASLRGSLSAMAERFAALARFSREKSAAHSLCDLAREISLLLDPLAADRHVRFELLLCAEGDTSADPPLASLVVLAAREIALAARADVPGRERIVRLRIGARGASEVVAWLSAMPALARDEAHERRVLAAVGAHPTCAGTLLLTGRTTGGARCWRMVFPAEVQAVHARPRPRARILLVHADEQVGDLVAEVLSEEFRVRRATPGRAVQDALERARFELVLVDAHSLAADPLLVRSWRRRVSGTGKHTVAVLGRAPDPEPSLAHYAEPLAPEPLLRFVRTCLSS